jgi:hypothetical protein
LAAVNRPLPASSGEANVWKDGLADPLHPASRMSITKGMMQLVMAIVRIARDISILQNLNRKHFINVQKSRSLASAAMALGSPATVA